MRITTITAPKIRYPRNARAHGASVRHATTTVVATAMISPSSSGLVVLDAATASPAAHAHHAAGWMLRSVIGVPSTLVVGGR